MIEQIEWNRSGHTNELLSPFMRGKGERALHITLQSDSFSQQPSKSRDAVELLRNLGKLSEIELVETNPSSHQHIQVGDIDPTADYIPIHLMEGNEVRSWTGVLNPRQLYDEAIRLSNNEKQTANEALDDLVLAQAHCEIGGDILVTSSSFLQKHKHTSEIHEANPCTPVEATQIVGLFLRSRDIYACYGSQNFKLDFSRRMFYWILARHLLPNMWKYFRACAAAGKTRGDDTQGLGAAILVRAVRALEARDAIGMQFYLPQNNSTRDQMMYHFEVPSIGV